MNWFEDALKVNNLEANACVLSSVSSDNYPSSRVVLLKGVNENGFTFFTNYKSSKAKDIDANPNVALNFYWPELERQVRIVGIAKKITINDSDTYFKSRPRESQMGAWLSDQSKVIGLDYNFMETLNSLESKFKDKEVERPLHWGGYCIEPIKVEFWQGRPSRLHDRLEYKIEDGKWIYKRLAP
tara:strand:- start:417 stop:968 length:552 start_codon:yes stop_codon:yes gene_type:complete